MANGKERATTPMNNERSTTPMPSERSTTPMTSPSERSTAPMMGGDRSTTPMPSTSGSQRSTVTLFSGDSKTNGREVDVKALIGEKINDYEIDDVISYQSGQSIVYTAKKKNKKFVIKLYRDDATVIDPDVVQILEKLKSNYIIPVLDSGTYNGRFYTITPFYEEGCVMDHLGELDKDLIKNNYINQLNEALHAIHVAGIMHCDIKPHNMYFADNRQRLVIGDFGIALAVNKYSAEEGKTGKYIPKRNLLENNATKAYLAPEGDEYVSALVDYYALGMSILNMAFGGDVYEDVSDNVIRDVLMNEPIRIPDNVDREIAMLILKLLESDPKRRIGYEEVKKWCKDKSIFGRYVNKENSLCPIQINHALVKGNICDSTEEYVDALLDNFSDCYKSEYQTEKIHNLLANVEDVDRAVVKEFAQIKDKYDKEKLGQEGFLLTMLKLSPSTAFRYRSVNFNDFAGYIDYLHKHINNETTLYNEEIFLQELDNEARTHKMKNVARIKEVCERIFAYTKDDVYYKKEMLCNYFYDSPSIYLDEGQYKDITLLADLMFDENFEPIANKKIFNDLFLDCLLTRDTALKGKEEELRQIFAIKDTFERNAKFSMFLTGQINYSYRGESYNNLFSFREWAKDLYENTKDCGQLAMLLKSGILYKACKLDNQVDDEQLNFLKSFTDSKYKNSSDRDILTVFYNKTQEHASFVLDGVKVDSMGDLISKLGETKDIESVSTKLVNSYQFKVWLENSGFKDSLNSLKGN